MSFPTGCRDVVYQLRAQGLNIEEIETALKSRFPGERTPSDTQIWRWLSDPEAQALVKVEESRIRAVITQRTAEILPDAYAALKEAVTSRDSRAADAYSRAVVNMTRGFVQERVELTQGDRKVDAVDELSAIALRHGLRLESGAQTSSASDAKPNDPA